MIELNKLKSLEKHYDKWTVDQLKSMGINEGWRCLEVAAGAGSIANWLNNEVGETGCVVAADIETKYLNKSLNKRISIIEHDILSGPIAQKEFDLVHSRFLLDMLPSWDRALDNLLASVKPGGQVLLEEFDSLTFIPISSASINDLDVFNKVRDAINSIYYSKGFDPKLGRKLAAKLVKKGLINIKAEGRTHFRQGGTDGVNPWKLTVEKYREAIQELNTIPKDYVDRHQELMDNKLFTFIAPSVISVSGILPNNN